MGCDIHLYKEKNVNGKWITADEGWEGEYNEGWIDVPFNNRFTKRDYDLFGFLSAGVRREFAFSFKQRGLPIDVCSEVKALSDKWGSDGHSHSYLYLHELVDAWNALAELKTPVSGVKELIDMFNDVDGENHRIVFWFDN